MLGVSAGLVLTLVACGDSSSAIPEALAEGFVVNASSHEVALEWQDPVAVDCAYMTFPKIATAVEGAGQETTLAIDEVVEPWTFPAGRRCYAATVAASFLFEDGETTGAVSATQVFDTELPKQDPWQPQAQNTITIVDSEGVDWPSIKLGPSSDRETPFCDASGPDWESLPEITGEVEVYSAGRNAGYLEISFVEHREYILQLWDFPSLDLREGDRIVVDTGPNHFRVETLAGELMAEVRLRTALPAWMDASHTRPVDSLVGLSEEACVLSPPCGHALSVEPILGVADGAAAAWGEEFVVNGPDGPVKLVIYEAGAPIDNQECGIQANYALLPAP